MKIAQLGIGDLDLFGFSTVDGYTVFTCGTDGFVYKSSDSGTTWSTVNSNLNVGYILYTVEQANNDFVLVLGESDYVIKSTNGGSDWTVLNVFPDSDSPISFLPPHAISILSPSVVFIGSLDGVIMQTKTAGEKWYQANFMESSNLNPIYTLSVFSTNVGVAGKQKI